MVRAFQLALLISRPILWSIRVALAMALWIWLWRVRARRESSARTTRTAPVMSATCRPWQVPTILTFCTRVFIFRARHFRPRSTPTWTLAASDAMVRVLSRLVNKTFHGFVFVWCCFFSVMIECVACGFFFDWKCVSYFNRSICFFVFDSLLLVAFIVFVLEFRIF